MAYYYKSETEVSPVPPPDKPPAPPLVIWGPGYPRPTLPIAGWNPGTGTWPDRPPPTTPPPEINTDPMPSNPIAEPPWGWGNPAPKPPVDPIPGWKITWLDGIDRLDRVCCSDLAGADTVEEK
jgi:hypothetical protein